MQIKSELRAEFKIKRAAIENKSEKDRLICCNFLSSELYVNSNDILCYCSAGSEIDTSLILSNVLKDGKRLFLPKCTDNRGNMIFYQVKDLSLLKVGMFGIKEPSESGEPFVNGVNAVCVVPGLSFDHLGHRLGYGGGYYDRFLEKFTIKSAGLCYNKLISDELPAEEHDLPVDYIFTENKVIRS